MRKRVKWLIFGVLAFLVAAVGSGQIQGVVAYDENEWPGWGEVGIFENPNYISSVTYPPDTRVRQKWKRFLGVRAQFFPVAALPEYDYWLVNSVETRIEPAFYGEDVDACLDMGKCGRTEAGILVDRLGPRWFVWSQLPITCLRGQVGWLDPKTDKVRGCIGKPFSLVGANKWNYVILRQAPTSLQSWEAYVNGRQVAKLKVHTGEDSNVIDGAVFLFYPENSSAGFNIRGGFWNKPPDFLEYKGWGTTWTKSPGGYALPAIDGDSYVDPPSCVGNYRIQDRVVDQNGEGTWFTGTKGLGDGGPSVCRAEPLY
jgi:hypothetical protein